MPIPTPDRPADCVAQRRPMLLLLRLLVAAALLVPASLGAARADEPGEGAPSNEAAAGVGDGSESPDEAPERGDDPDRVVVARVYDRPIYFDMLALPEKAMAVNRRRLGEERYEEWLHEQHARMLREAIFKRMMNAYMRENGVTVNEEDVADFLNTEHEIYLKVLAGHVAKLKDLEETRDELEKLNAQVPDDLQREITITRKKIENLERKNVDNMMLDPKQRALYDRVQRERAILALKAWKFHRALHEQFGGKVVVSNLSYEPYEAYADWLTIEEQLGTYEILDESLRESYWEHYHAEREDTLEPFPGMWDQLRWTGSGLP